MLLFSAVFAGLFLSAHAVLAQDLSISDECKKKVEQAETTNDLSVYDSCGFNDVKVAWDEWAGLASQKKYKKAQYQLCARWPSHPYSDMYCEKSANLGYAPAIIEQGHRLMEKGLDETAITYYARALQTQNLTDEQEGQVAEQLALYYLDEKSKGYAPSKAVMFFTEAAKKRSALANNALGYLFYTGELGGPANDEMAFKSFWRAILLGCTAAEENLGVFHLARLQQIDRPTAIYHMKQVAFTCEGISEKPQVALVRPLGCGCEAMADQMEKYKDKPYYLVEISGQKATLKDKKGAVIVVEKGNKTAQDYHVLEVRKTAVILGKEGNRVILNLTADWECIDYCQKMKEDGVQSDVHIRPYRLTFTPQECQDLMYYAPQLVDTTKPFVGQRECAGGSEAISDPLLELLRDNPQKQMGQPVQSVQQIDFEADLFSNVQQNTEGIKVPQVKQAPINKRAVVKPRPNQNVQKPRKKIRFTVGELPQGEAKQQ